MYKKRTEYKNNENKTEKSIQKKSTRLGNIMKINNFAILRFHRSKIQMFTKAVLGRGSFGSHFPQSG